MANKRPKTTHDIKEVGNLTSKEKHTMKPPTNAALGIIRRTVSKPNDVLFNKFVDECNCLKDINEVYCSIIFFLYEHAIKLEIKQRRSGLEVSKNDFLSFIEDLQNPRQKHPRGSTTASE